MGESVPDFIAGWFAGNQNLVMHVQSYISHHLSTCVTINHLDVIQFSCWYTGCAGVIAGQPADTVKVLILTTLSSLLNDGVFHIHILHYILTGSSPDPRDRCCGHEVQKYDTLLC